MPLKISMNRSPHASVGIVRASDDSCNNAAERLHPRDRPIPRGRPQAVPRDVRRPGRWDDDRRLLSPSQHAEWSKNNGRRKQQKPNDVRHGAPPRQSHLTGNALGVYGVWSLDRQNGNPGYKALGVHKASHG